MSILPSSLSDIQVKDRCFKYSDCVVFLASLISSLFDDWESCMKNAVKLPLSASLPRLYVLDNHPLVRKTLYSLDYLRDDDVVSYAGAPSAPSLLILWSRFKIPPSVPSMMHPLCLSSGLPSGDSHVRHSIHVLHSWYTASWYYRSPWLSDLIHLLHASSLSWRRNVMHSKLTIRSAWRETSAYPSFTVPEWMKRVVTFFDSIHLCTCSFWLYVYILDVPWMVGGVEDLLPLNS